MKRIRHLLMLLVGVTAIALPFLYEWRIAVDLLSIAFGLVACLGFLLLGTMNRSYAGHWFTCLLVALLPATLCGCTSIRIVDSENVAVITIVDDEISPEAAGMIGAVSGLAAGAMLP